MSKRGDAWGVLALVFVAALGVRLTYVMQVADNPFYSVLMFDSKSYDDQALSILGEGLLSGEEYFIGPLYVYFLALIYLAAGHSIKAVMFAQAFVDSLTCMLACYIGMKLFSRKTGLLAGLAAAVYGPMVFYTAAVLSETLLVFLDTLLVLLLVVAYERGEPRVWLASGVVMGLSALGKPNILLLYPAFAALNVVRPLKGGEGRNILVMLAGILLVVAPVMLRNIAVGGGAAITANAGYNFYIGNNPKATGMFIPISELASSSGRSVYVEATLLESGVGGGPWQAELLWFWKACEYVINDPAGFAGLLFRKTMLYLNAYEIPQLYDYNFLRGGSILAYLIPSMAVVAPLGLLGMTMNAWDKKSWPASLYVVVYSASIILFFITSRYRIPVMPVVIVFAADAAVYMVSNGLRDLGSLKAKTAILLVLAFVVNNQRYNASGFEMASMLNPYNNLGVAYASAGELQKAVESYKNALELNPYHYEAYNNLGSAYNQLGEYDKAEESLKKAVKLNSLNAYAHNNLGTTYYHKGRMDEAIVEYLEALRLNKYYFEAHNNLGGVYMALNQTGKALTQFQIAVELDPKDATAHYNLGVAYFYSGGKVKGLRELKTASELDPGYREDYVRASGSFKAA